jgi:hypothetical protein
MIAMNPRFLRLYKRTALQVEGLKNLGIVSGGA